MLLLWSFLFADDALEMKNDAARQTISKGGGKAGSSRSPGAEQMAGIDPGEGGAMMLPGIEPNGNGQHSTAHSTQHTIITRMSLNERTT